MFRACDFIDFYAFILFNLHAGTNFSSGTLNTTWQSNDNTDRAAGIDSLLSSTDNELYITGVQLEVGSTATPFEHRSFGEEEALCQRYYFQTTSVYYLNTYGNSPASYSIGNYVLPVSMRANPTVTMSDSLYGSSFGAAAIDRSALYIASGNTASSAPRTNFDGLNGWSNEPIGVE